MRSSFNLHVDHSALLVVDMQRYFCDKDSDAQVPQVDKTISKIKKLIDFFSENRRPIVFTRHIDSNESDNMMLKWWSENIREEDPMSELISDFETSRGEVLIKHQYDAFFNTDLESYLKDKGVKQVLICGVLTNLCCETTARSAFMRGFEVYFATDATATFKQDMHKATLLNLSYGFATLVTVNDVLCIKGKT